MKKIIQITSVLTLLFFIAGAKASAQSGGTINASIPHDFQVGDEQFDSGEYAMRLRKLSNGGGMLVELRDSQHRIVWESFAIENGYAGSSKSNLVFDGSGPIAKLTEVRVGGKGYSISTKKTERGVAIAAKRKKKGDETRN